ncbi:MAG: cytochrome d ubiquinol oxidase subunit II [Myxococcota bacterium]
MSPELLLAAWIVAALVVYSLSGGADYGGGVWDLLARGPRAAKQRELIEHAIAPVWETNHVWLIAAVVALFSGFPKAFSLVSTALHLPLTLLLLGIVARGTSFVFRSYDAKTDSVQRRWGLVFSVSSTVTPLLLGVIVGSIGSGEIKLENGVVTSGFVRPWLTNPFVWSVGVFALALFAYLAAVYLANEATDPPLQDDFRRRAMGSFGVVSVLAIVTASLSAPYAPHLFHGLWSGQFSTPVFVGTAAASALALYALVRRRFRVARIAAMVQVALIVIGWAVAQAPFLVVGALEVQAAAAPPQVLWVLLTVLAVGVLPLSLLLYQFFRIFKGAPR